MPRNYSTFAIARLLNVDPGSVANWMDQGLLKSHRTPGGHRRATEDALIQFLREHKMPIPPELKAEAAKILIVDDEESVAKMIGKAVQASQPDHDILIATDGFKAGTIIATQKPAVVVLDLRMPGMDGYEVCKQIKADQATKHIEVIAVTAYHSQEVEKKILDCGARICLSKPLDMDVLFKELEACL